MILLDTSVWIEFFRGREPVAAAVRELLENRRVLAVECIFAELLQWALDERERSIVTAYWENLPHADTSGNWLNAGESAGREKLRDKSVGLIDAYILTCAETADARLWTLDKKLARVAPRDVLYARDSSATQ